MKLLLTSAGVTNNTIKNALISLVRKTPQSTVVAFIPTAANAENNSGPWFLGQIDSLNSHGYRNIDFVDISASDVDWRSRLNVADVVFVSGGNSFHLLNQYRVTGFDKWLKRSLGRKVYVGSSAGSIVVTPTIDVAAIPPADSNLPNIENLNGVKLVNFEVEPHCTRSRFSTVEFYAQSRRYPVYAIDDASAIVVNDDHTDIVSEGSWKLFQ